MGFLDDADVRVVDDVVAAAYDLFVEAAPHTVLLTGGSTPKARFERLTSNQFLAALGDPAEVEAEIGRLYESEGLDAAFRMIETRLISLHNKQEIKRLRGLQ